MARVKSFFIGQEVEREDIKSNGVLVGEGAVLSHRDSLSDSSLCE